VKVAVIDLGTNSARLLLAAVEQGAVHDAARLTTVTRLGAGVDRQRRIDPAAAARTRSCLAGYAARVAAYAPDARLLVATSALRDAADGRAFLDGLTAEFDLPATILSGEQEAALSYAGALSAVGTPSDREGGPRTATVGPPSERPAAAPPAQRPAAAVIDIGGGSLELAVGTPPAPEPSFVCSLDIGVVRLTERFFASDPPDEGQWRAAESFVRATLAAALPGDVRAAVGRGIGVAGTFTTLVAHKLALRTYDRALVHGHRLTLADIDGALAAFRRVPSAARGRLPGIQPGREDVILAGVLLAREVCRLFDLTAVRVSEADLLDGVALRLARG
jgi:exopolyphosphatase/guanosine-5'-triphosphate,3'-diphosphate pyrophosphatase